MRIYSTWNNKNINALLKFIVLGQLSNKIHTTNYFIYLYGGLSEHALVTAGVPDALLSQTPSVLVSIFRIPWIRGRSKNDFCSHLILLFKPLTQQWIAVFPDPLSSLSQMSLNEFAVLSTLDSTSSNRAVDGKNWFTKDD